MSHTHPPSPSPPPRYYKERGWDRDFYILPNPAWLDARFPDLAPRVQRPSVAIVSTDEAWVKFMKVRDDGSGRWLSERVKARALVSRCNEAVEQETNSRRMRGHKPQRRPSRMPAAPLSPATLSLPPSQLRLDRVALVELGNVSPEEALASSDMKLPDYEGEGMRGLR